MSEIKISMGENPSAPGMKNQFAPATMAFNQRHVLSRRNFVRQFDNEFGESTEQLEIRLRNQIALWNAAQHNWVYSIK